jgi:hypothetical protein
MLPKKISHPRRNTSKRVPPPKKIPRPSLLRKREKATLRKRKRKRKKKAKRINRFTHIFYRRRADRTDRSPSVGFVSAYLVGYLPLFIASGPASYRQH